MSRHLLLARHGQSTANAADVFTGWSDPPLTERGLVEAHAIAATLAESDIVPDVMFASGLHRAIHSAAIIRDDLCLPVEIVSSDALNEATMAT